MKKKIFYILLLLSLSVAIVLLLLLFIFSGLVVASLAKTSRCASWDLRAPHPTPPSPPLFRQSGGAFWDTRRKKCLTKHGFYVCGQENTNFFAWKYSSVKHVSQNNSTDCRRLARMPNLWEPNFYDTFDQVSCFHDHEGDEGK